MLSQVTGIHRLHSVGVNYTEHIDHVRSLFTYICVSGLDPVLVGRWEGFAESVLSVLISDVSTVFDPEFRLRGDDDFSRTQFLEIAPCAYGGQATHMWREPVRRTVAGFRMICTPLAEPVSAAAA